MSAPVDPRERDSDSPTLPFLLSTFQGHPPSTRIFDYTQKYPVDKEGKELDHDSRTWKVYIDEHESYDYDMVKGFRDNIDALLVLAALFSSIVTGFVVPAAERLEPDNAKINTSILYEATLLLRANGNATLIEATPRSELQPESATHTTADVCVAWMFFASLTLSLSTALVSILAKQWLQAFTALVSGDAKRRSLTRQFRFAGMRKWKFAEIVGFLPLLLHLSLLLFLVGLCVYVDRCHWSFLAMVGFISLCAVVFYVVTAALPAVYLDCPYRIPILFRPASIGVYGAKQLRYYMITAWSSIKKLQRPLSTLSGNLQPVIPWRLTARDQTTRQSMANHPSAGGGSQEEHVPDGTTPDTAQSSPHGPISRPQFIPSSLSTQERKYVEQSIHSLEFSSLEWLYTQTTNTSVQRIALHALARAFEKCASHRVNEAEHTLPIPRRLLEEMHSFALAIINGISGSMHVANDVAQLLDFHIHLSNALKCEKNFSESRWPVLIKSPHLPSFTERNLLPFDAKITVGDCKGYPLHIACYIGRWDFVESHINDFPHSHWTEGDSEGWLPLGIGVKFDKLSIKLWQYILSKYQRAWELPINKEGDTALPLLCYKGAELAKIESFDKVLIFPCNAQRHDGQTPLHRLCANTDNPSQRLEIAKYLLSRRADMSLVDSNQHTPLDLHTLENGQDILNQRDKIGATALHFAVFFGALDSTTLQALISAGADPNIVNNNHVLPLHLACNTSFSAPRREYIAILMDRTKDINMRDNKGETPLDWFMRRKSAQGWPDIYDLMRKKGAKHAGEPGPAEETVSEARDPAGIK